jgi:hypothetical protein
MRDLLYPMVAAPELVRKQMKKCLLWIAILVFSCVAVAQEKPAEKKIEVPPVKTAQKRVADRNFWILTGVTVAATVYDTETTFAGIKNGAREGNPLMRPFVESGRPATYAVQMAVTGGISYLAYRQKKRGSAGWWFFPVVLTVGHTVAGSLNLRYVF